MKTKLYLCGILALAAMAAGCTGENIDGRESEDGRIQLSALTRNDGVNGTNIYLRAFADSALTQDYIPETLVTFPYGLDDTEREIVFPGGSPYYPLGQNEIYFFAYSGKADGTDMVIVAGLGDEYDAVLSNYGQRSSDGGINAAYEGKGTPGTSDLPAEVLQFRHVMTQVNVVVVIDSTESIPVEPHPSSISFTIDGVYEQGRYPITAIAPDTLNPSAAETATPVTTNIFTLREGVNYLIPSGLDLTGMPFSSLVIDDYTATPADLSGFTIQPESTNPGAEMLLLPGYSYQLKLFIQRLRVTAVQITLEPWLKREVSDSLPSYEAYPLTLDISGGYDNSGDDAITKVVLYTDDRMYVGSAENGSTDIQFITLPASGVVRAELYTAKGLLASRDITTEYASQTLTLTLSAGGMIPEDPGQNYGQNNPYMVTNPLQFYNISKDLGGYYKLAGNMDMDNLVVADDADGFAGFGNFSGVLDGNGYWIGNIEFAGPGLFASNSGTIRGVRVLNGIIDASNETYAGGIAAQNSGTIVGCTNEAYIRSNGTAGGIVGLNLANGTVRACINTGRVEEADTAGGICGENRNGNEGAIASCINTGNVNSSASAIGGICGRSVVTSDTIFRVCYWLVGTAQEEIGGAEKTVGTNGALTYECTDMDPDKLRDGYTEPEGPTDIVTVWLNTELKNYSPWDTIYEFVYDPALTGITWPMPVIIE